jgi:hypothetical protein
MITVVDQKKDIQAAPQLRKSIHKYGESIQIHASPNAFSWVHHSLGEKILRRETEW